MADTATKTKVNYTAEMVETILRMYAELGNEGMEQIAAAVQRPVRSVRAKLVREGVYVAPPKGPKMTREDGPTKKELLAQLNDVFEPEVLDGLVPATKLAIQAVIELAERVEGETAEVEPEQPQGEAEEN